MRSALKWLLLAYGLLGLICFVYQFSFRYIACSGAFGCGLSFAKGIVWSAIWPAYWAIQWDLFKF